MPIDYTLADLLIQWRRRGDWSAVHIRRTPTSASVACGRWIPTERVSRTGGDVSGKAFRCYTCFHICLSDAKKAKKGKKADA